VKTNLKKFAIIASLSVAVLATAAVVVFSQNPPPRPDAPPAPGAFRHRGPGGPGGPGGPREFGPFGPFGRELNLTEDQKTQIKNIQDSFRDSNKALFDQMRALHEQQGDPASGTFDEAAVRSAAEARAKVQVELEVSHAKMMSQVFNVLTAEQKAQLAAHRDEMKRMGPPAPPPPPREPEGDPQL
jgi:Spy/CpxP family protein refolding chaperone